MVNKEQNSKTIGDKIKELEQATEWFYSDEFKLDEATEKYEQARELAREIEEDLAELKNKIEVIDKDFSKE